jgi:uncharacterized heparinase superfamily protein
MYHALAVEDMLDLCNLMSCYRNDLTPAELQATATWRDITERMRKWLHATCHPDGEIAFFNDAAIGIAPSPRELDDYAIRLGLSTLSDRGDSGRWLAASGYARLSNDRAVLIADIAPVGPDYLPGHAHADTLSFELSVRGRRMIVNSGTSCYGSGPERMRQRGTAAHSTVTVDSADSSEVWSGFRVARRARVVKANVSIQPGEATAYGAHDGYSRLPGHPIHSRKWTLVGNALVVEDEVEGGAYSAEAWFHLHPDATPAPGTTTAVGLIRLPDGEQVGWAVEVGDLQIQPSTWHPRFGQTVSSTCLRVRLAGGRAKVRFTWA